MLTRLKEIYNKTAIDKKTLSVETFCVVFTVKCANILLKSVNTAHCIYSRIKTRQEKLFSHSATLCVWKNTPIVRIVFHFYKVSFFHEKFLATGEKLFTTIDNDNTRINLQFIMICLEFRKATIKSIWKLDRPQDKGNESKWKMLSETEKEHHIRLEFLIISVKNWRNINRDLFSGMTYDHVIPIHFSRSSF